MWKFGVSLLKLCFFTSFWKVTCDLKEIEHRKINFSSFFFCIIFSFSFFFFLLFSFFLFLYFFPLFLLGGISDCHPIFSFFFSWLTKWVTHRLSTNIFCFAEMQVEHFTFVFLFYKFLSSSLPSHWTETVAGIFFYSSIFTLFSLPLPGAKSPGEKVTDE